jgi:hypothetical protein
MFYPEDRHAEKLSTELEAWQLDRNERQKIVRRQFTAEGVRIKLHGSYPEF